MSVANVEHSQEGGSKFQFSESSSNLSLSSAYGWTAPEASGAPKRLLAPVAPISYSTATPHVPCYRNQSDREEEGKVMIELRFGLGARDVGSAKSAQRSAFELGVSQDLSLATGEKAERFLLGDCKFVDGSAPCVVLPIEIRAEPWNSSNTQAKSVAMTLLRQAADNTSLLFSGSVTQNLQHLKVPLFRDPALCDSKQFPSNTTLSHDDLQAMKELQHISGIDRGELSQLIQGSRVTHVSPHETNDPLCTSSIHSASAKMLSLENFKIKRKTREEAERKTREEAERFFQLESDLEASNMRAEVESNQVRFLQDQDLKRFDEIELLRSRVTVREKVLTRDQQKVFKLEAEIRQIIARHNQSMQKEKMQSQSKQAESNEMIRVLEGQRFELLQGQSLLEKELARLKAGMDVSNQASLQIGLGSPTKTDANPEQKLDEKDGCIQRANMRSPATTIVVDTKGQAGFSVMSMLIDRLVFELGELAMISREFESIRVSLVQEHQNNACRTQKAQDTIAALQKQVVDSVRGQAQLEAFLTAKQEQMHLISGDFDVLKVNHDSCCEKLQDMQVDVNRLQDANKACEELITSLQNKVSDLECENRNIKLSKTSCDDDVLLHRSQVLDLETRSKQFQHDSEDLKRVLEENAGLHKDANAMSNELEILRAKVIRLSNELQSTRAKDENLMQETHERENTTETLANEVNMKQEDIMDKEMQVLENELQNQVLVKGSNEHRLDCARLENLELRTKVESLELENQKLAGALSAKERVLNGIIEGHCSAIAEFKEQKEALLHGFRTDFDALESDKQAELRKLKQLLDTKDAEMNALMIEHESQNALQLSEVNKARSLLADRTKEAEQLKGRLAVNTAATVVIKDELARLQWEFARLDCEHGGLLHLSSENDLLRQENLRIKMELSVKSKIAFKSKEAEFCLETEDSNVDTALSIVTPTCKAVPDATEAKMESEVIVGSEGQLKSSRSNQTDAVDDIFECEFRCGFSGMYDEVLQHEKACRRKPRNKHGKLGLPGVTSEDERNTPPLWLSKRKSDSSRDFACVDSIDSESSGDGMSVEWDCSQEEDVHLNAGWGRTWTEEESLTLEQSERKWEVERGRMQQELLEWERQREINGSRDEDVDSEVLQGISSDLRRLGLLPSTSQGGENGEVIDKEVEQDRTIKFQEESQTSPPAGHVAERLHEAPAMRQPSLSDPVNMSSQDCVRNAQPSRPVLAAGGSVQQCLPGIQNISPLAEVQRSRVAGVGMVVEHSDGLVKVKELREGPAKKCGKIHVGDFILHVDGHKVDSVDEMEKLVVGDEGSIVAFTVLDGTSFQSQVIPVSRSFLMDQHPDQDIATSPLCSGRLAMSGLDTSDENAALLSKSRRREMPVPSSYPLPRLQLIPEQLSRGREGRPPLYETGSSRRSEGGGLDTPSSKYKTSFNGSSAMLQRRSAY